MHGKSMKVLDTIRSLHNVPEHRFFIPNHLKNKPIHQCTGTFVPVQRFSVAPLDAWSMTPHINTAIVACFSVFLLLPQALA